MAAEGAGMMKNETWMIVVVLLLLMGMAAVMKMNTVVGQQQRALVAGQQETDRLIAHVYWTGIKNRPIPYRHPLDQLWISSGTGYRMDPMGGIDAEEKLHKGLDLVGKIGDPVYAWKSGIVAEHWPYGDHPTYGKLVVIKHEAEGLYSLYGHLHQTFVHEGDYVVMGQIIGSVGNTGISTGPHLHFEIVVDPLLYLEEQ